MKRYDIGTREARAELPSRSSCYWYPIRVGRALGYRRKSDNGNGIWYIRFKVKEKDRPVIRSFKRLGFPPLADDEPVGHNPEWSIPFKDAYAIAKGYDHQKGACDVVVVDPDNEDLAQMLRQIIQFNEHAINEANKLRDLVAFNEWIFSPLELRIREGAKKKPSE